MDIRLATAVLVAGAGLSCAAQAQCDLSLELPGQVRYEGNDGTGYQSFEASRFEADFTVRVSNAAEAPCEALLSIQRTDSAAGLTGPTGSTLDYAVTRPGSLSTILDSQAIVGRPPNAVAVTVPAGESRTVPLALQLTPRQIVPSGVYSETVLVRMIDASDLSIVAERSVQFVTNVRSAMSILLYDGGFAAASAGAGGARRHELDFGTLQEGEQASVTVLVQSNDEYELRFSSAHSGALWHTVRGAAERIPYSAAFGGRELDLAAGEATASRSDATGLGGVARPLSVRIGRVGPVRAGRYEDEIVITVLPVG